MKKLIALVTLLFAFTISANAQDKKVSNAQAAQTAVDALAKKVTISESLKKDMLTLMTMKYDALKDAKSPAEKEKISQAYGHKIMSALSQEQRDVVAKDTELVNQLTKE